MATSAVLPVELAAWFHERGEGAWDTWRTVLRPAGRALLSGQTEVIGEDISRSSLDEVLELQRHPDPLGGNFLSSRDAVQTVLGLLIEGADPEQLRMPEATVNFVRECARSDVPLLAFLRELRVAHRCFSARCLRELELHTAGPTSAFQAVALFNEFTFRIMEGFGEQVTEVYTVERERLVRTAASVRGETIRAILRGEIHDSAQASRRLGYRLEGPHVGLLLWDTSGRPHCESTDLEQAAHQIASVAGATGPLLMPIDAHTVWAWVGTTHIPDGAKLGRGLQNGVRVAIGETHDGLVGFASTHREANDLHRLATTDPHNAALAAPVLRYRDLELAILMLHDPGKATQFITRHLGDLARRDPATDVLADTLLAYLQSGRRPSIAAQELHVHPNTVTYRVARAQERCEHPFTTDCLELQVALRVRGLIAPD